MADFITTAFVQDYKTTVMFLAQQKGSRLRDLVTTDSYRGMAGKVVEQFGSVQAQQRTSRHADTPLIEVPQDSRWVYPTDWEWADLIDDQDKLRMAIDPTSPLAQAGAFAMGRAIDNVLMAAFYGAAQTGQTGATSTAFSNAQKVSVNQGGNNTNLNVEKLREGRRLFYANNLDLEAEQLAMVITSKEQDALLALTQVISVDFNDRPVLVDGKIQRFLGINFRHMEFSSLAAFPNQPSMMSGTTRLCPLFLPTAMHLGVWEDTVAHMSQRADKGYATQVYLRQTIGATRLEEVRIAQVACY